MSNLSRRRSALRIGLISDLHAHIHQLERALSILEAAGVDKLVCLGDVVEKGPQPDKVIERLDSLYIPTVKGNHDQNAVRHASLDARGCGMSRDSVAWLDALPTTREYVWAGLHVALAHISLGEDDVGVRPHEVPKRMRRSLRNADADVVLLGHTHIPMRFRWDGRWLCNPGSITSGRCRLGATCAVLVLPEVTLEVYSMQTGGRVELAG